MRVLPAFQFPCRRWLFWAAWCLAAALLNGCLSRPALVRQSFAFASPAAGSVASPPHGPVLAIRRLTVAAPFDGQSFLYRTGEFSYERDPYAEFLDSPEQLLGPPIRAWLRESGKFAAVVEPGSALRPTLLVEVAVSRLYGDFRQGRAPAAVLEMRFLFFAAGRDTVGPLQFQKNYTERLPLRRRTAASLVAGWNEALGRIIEEAAREESRD